MNTTHCRIEFDMEDMHSELTGSDYLQIVEDLVKAFKDRFPRASNCWCEAEVDGGERLRSKTL
jgi:hypothetical protein